MNQPQTILLSIMLGAAAALMTLAVSMSISPAHSAQPAVAMNAPTKPLMVIRFNQRKVFYERQLYNALSKAIRVAPAARFQVISYIPYSGDQKRDRAWMQKANGHLEGVMGHIRDIGIPTQQLGVNNQFDPSLSHDEIHIFVR